MPNAVFLSFIKMETDGILWFLYYEYGNVLLDASMEEFYGFL
jgi:hypothetical protein